MGSIKKTSIFKAIIFLTVIISGLVIFLFFDRISTFTRQISAYYYVFSGDQYYQKGKYQEAITDYNQALQIYPGYSKAQYNLANIYTQYEDFYSAIDFYEQTLNNNPNYISARINLGVIFAEELHDIDRAINEYLTAVNSGPETIKIPFINSDSKIIKLSKAIAYYNLGLAYRAKSLLYSDDTLSSRTYLSYAVDSYKKSIEIEPNNYNAHYNLALTLHLLGNYSEALQEYCRAIKVVPFNYDAHYNLAILLKKTGRYKEAAEELEKAGLVLGIEGNGDKADYVYQILSDVNQRAISTQNNKSAQKNCNGAESCEICMNISLK